MTKKPGPVREPEARAAYIAMEGRRSVARLRMRFLESGREAPSQRTFEEWRSRNQWVRLAYEHDEAVAAGAVEVIAKDATEQTVTRARQFDTLATESLTKAIEGLAKISVDSLKASDIRALTEVSERAAKMYELLEGRATDRTDDMTRAKMDTLMGQMRDEIEERLASVPTIH